MSIELFRYNYARKQRHLPRVIDKYAKLGMDDRDKLESIIGGMLGLGEKK